jgi:hypothetical protein
LKKRDISKGDVEKGKGIIENPPLKPIYTYRMIFLTSRKLLL